MSSTNVVAAFCSSLPFSLRTAINFASISSSHSSSNNARPLSSRKPVVALVDLRDEQTKVKEQEQVEIQRATDPAPGPYAYFAEQVNGRAAMVGFVAGLLIELTSGVTINNQISLIAGGVAKQGFLMLAPFIELFARSVAQQ